MDSQFDKKKYRESKVMIRDFQDKWSKRILDESKKPSKSDDKQGVKVLMPKAYGATEKTTDGNVSMSPVFTTKYFIGQGLSQFFNKEYFKALKSFQVVLKMEPNNSIAKGYIDKINEKITRYSISHFGCNLMEWDFKMDLDLSWTGILKALFGLILNKISSFPRLVRKSSAVVKQG